MKQAYICLFCLAFVISAYGQPYKVHGILTDKATGEPIAQASVTIKETGKGYLTNAQGRFEGSVSHLPVTLIISHVGYDKLEVIAAHTNEISVSLTPAPTIIDGVVLASKGLPTNIMKYPSSAEFIGPSAIRQLPTTSIYDATVYKKGFDQTTSSLTFKTPSTRGFNGSGSTRVNQLIDGMDNQAPGLNFFVGNFTAPTDLDIENIELLPGASSALYGPGGMNGTILINTKNPFKHPGFSFQARQGVMHVDKSQRGKASPYYDYSMRWAQSFKNKLAYKIGAQYVSARDWLANDSSNYLRNGTEGRLIPGNRRSDPNYDGVNVYGDETSVDIRAFMQAAIADNNNLLPILSPFLANPQHVSRTGYQEIETIDPETKNLKLSGALHYKINDGIEAQLMGYWATGNTVYTDDNRYALKGIKVGQYKLELKHKDWFVRTYTTQEDAGEAYSATVATQYFNEAWKRSFDPGNIPGSWYPQYSTVFITQAATRFQEAYIGALMSGQSPAEALAAAQGAVLNGSQQFHNNARDFADQGRPVAGTAQFKSLYDQVRKTPIPNGGLFKEKSQLWMTEGQYSFSGIKFANIVAGANYKKYILDSDGTLFIDAADPIKINEVGAYLQVSKNFFDEKLTVTASGRFDKNENFKGKFTPRVAALINIAKDQNLRLSYQTAYRFPGNLSQWIMLDVGSDYLLLGGLPWVMDSMDASKHPVYEIVNGVPAAEPYQYREFKPETMRSFEIGYKGLINNRLLIDAYGYFGKYRDFLGRIGLYQPGTGEAYSIVVNSANKVKTYGFGIGMDYRMQKNFSAFFNAYSDVITDVPEGFKSYFNTPKYRLNAGIANSGLGKRERFGFNVMLRWQDKFNWEGELANGPLPSFTTIDAQFSYKLPRIKSILRLGGTNITNNYYQNAYGNPKIGGLYYVSYIYNL
jgi:outer membrane receptor protein involved in Fe transport